MILSSARTFAGSRIFRGLIRFNLFLNLVDLCRKYGIQRNTPHSSCQKIGHMHLPCSVCQWTFNKVLDPWLAANIWYHWSHGPIHCYIIAGIQMIESQVSQGSYSNWYTDKGVRQMLMTPWPLIQYQYKKDTYVFILFYL